MNIGIFLFFFLSTSAFASHTDELNSIKLLPLNRDTSFFKFFVPMKDTYSQKQTICGIRLLSTNKEISIEDLTDLEKNIEVIDGYRHQRIFKLFPDFSKGLYFNLKNTDPSSTVITIYTKSGINLDQTIEEILGKKTQILIASKLCNL